jgi:hypothetical protein
VTKAGATKARHEGLKTLVVDQLVKLATRNPRRRRHDRKTFGKREKQNQALTRGGVSGYKDSRGREPRRRGDDVTDPATRGVATYKWAIKSQPFCNHHDRLQVTCRNNNGSHGIPTRAGRYRIIKTHGGKTMEYSNGTLAL